MFGSNIFVKVLDKPFNFIDDFVKYMSARYTVLIK